MRSTDHISDSIVRVHLRLSDFHIATVIVLACSTGTWSVVIVLVLMSTPPVYRRVWLHWDDSHNCDETTASSCAFKTALLECPIEGDSSRPLSPDTTLEVPSSRAEYEQVQNIIEREEQKYPRLLYDGVRNMTIIKAAPSALHAQMAESLVSHISNAANSVIAAYISGQLQSSSAETFTQDSGQGRTTREWDTALYFRQGTSFTLMIAVEVAVSQSHTSLQRAISWSICALDCPLGITLSITELRRQPGAIRTMYFSSLGEAKSIMAEYEAEFQRQLGSHPYGPLEHDGVVWFGNVRRVLLDTYRKPEDDCSPDTLLAPCQEITLVADGEYVGHAISENLEDFVLGDCVPSHLLQSRQSRQIRQIPINFFQRQWFEEEFKGAMVRTALSRVWRAISIRP
ncbi:hypothetical protein V1509DRAFT_650004 [Lipomyces kononenkoae]